MVAPVFNEVVAAQVSLDAAAYDNSPFWNRAGSEKPEGIAQGVSETFEELVTEATAQGHRQEACSQTL